MKSDLPTEDVHDHEKVSLETKILEDEPMNIDLCEGDVVKTYILQPKVE